MVLGRVATVWMLGLCDVVAVHAQSSGRTAPTPHQAATAADPLRIVEHEGNGCVASGTDYAIVWTFDNRKGMGKFDKTEQEMDIDSFDGHALVVRRTSYSGGLIGSGPIDGTAVYTGQINGTHITGTATYHPTGRGVTTGPWCGEIEDPRVLMPETLAAKQPLKDVPPQILECESSQYCDGLWSFTGSSGNALWPRNPNVLANLKVEKISPDQIVISRNDTAPNQFSAVYTGRINGNRITGTVVAHVGNVTGTGTWTATIPATSCVRSDGLKPDTQEALDVGKTAMRFNLLPAAFNCYLSAARGGDVSAELIVANMYQLGKGTKPNAILARYWTDKAAGVYSSNKSASAAAGQPTSSQLPASAASTLPTGTPAPPAAGQSTSYHLPASAAAALTADGCTRDEPSEPAASAFDTFIEAKQMKTDASDEGGVFEAMKLFCRAARAGSGLAAFELGEMYYNEGVSVPGARSIFGMHYDNVPPDVNKAFYWYKQAAALNNTEGMVNVAFFERSGTQVHWHSGDYSSVNQEPVNLAKAHESLAAAANAGDTQAMGQLSGEYSPKRIAARAKLWLTCQKLQRAMQATLPGHAIKYVYAGENHDHSYTCIATLYPPQQDDSKLSPAARLASDVAALKNGDEMSTWRFTMYWQTDPNDPKIQPASTTEEMMMSLNDLALVTGLLKNAGK